LGKERFSPPSEWIHEADASIDDADDNPKPVLGGRLRGALMIAFIDML